MSKEAAKGASYETDVSDYLAYVLEDDRIERRVKHGTNDKGDIAGVMLRQRKAVLECKNCKDMRLSKWIAEAEAERGNDDAEFCAVVHKRRGKGRKQIGESYVTMTLEMFAAIIAGGHEYLGEWHG